MIEPRIKRILVVDNDQTIADTFADILRKSGYDVIVHYDGQDALQRSDGWVPDLLFSDIVMPKVDGVALAIQIQERHPTCRVILCSGIETSREFVENTRLQGYRFEFMRKPVHPRDLLQKIAA